MSTDPLPDIIAPRLRLLLVGINPSLVSAETGHHYAGRGNGFWRALHEAGITDRVLRPSEDRTLLRLGVGSTNLVPRPTVGSGELKDRAELRAGLAELIAKIARFRPAHVVLLCKTEYNRAADRHRRVPPGEWGPMPWTLANVPVAVYPNPSGRNNGRRHLLIHGLRALWHAPDP